MRHAVKKPAPATKVSLKASVPHQQARHMDMVLKPAASIHADRLKRAQQISKSKRISHFSSENTETKHLQPPAALPAHKQALASQAKATPASLRPAKPGRPSARNAKEAMLQRALEKANSHEQPRHRAPKKRGRQVMAVASALAFIVLAGAGYFAVNNPDTVKLALVSAKAGFRATNPAQQLAGYTLSQANYGEGMVALQYGNSNGKSYTIIQKRSDLGDGGLDQQFSSADPDSYTTVNAGGKQVYLYGDQKATWIQDGIWYVIQSNGSLSDQELIDLASSL